MGQEITSPTDTVIIAIAVIGIADVTAENVHIITIAPTTGVVDREVVREITIGVVDPLQARLIAVPAPAQIIRAEMDAQNAIHQIVTLTTIHQTAIKIATLQTTTIIAILRTITTA